MHELPEQLPEAENVMFSSAVSWASQAWSWVGSMLMNCPLQKSAPAGDEHCVLQPPVTFDWQLAYPISWQLMSQVKLACAWQLPWQAAWQDTGVQLGGEPLQLP